MIDIIESIEWARATIKDRLMFGMEDAPLQAAYSREKRASSVLIDCKNEIENQQKKIDELRESLKVCQRDYNSMIRLLNGLDNIAVRDCIVRMNLRKAMFKKSLEEKEAQ